MNLKEFKKEIDPLIELFIENKIKNIPQDEDLYFLKEQFKYIKKLIKDGKRIRPYVAYITFLSFGGKENRKIINLLFFIEIFHYFCLIHDDIMDNSDLRHGIKTLNTKFGNSEALLLGDYLFSWSWENLLYSIQDSKQKDELIAFFQEMIDDVFLGQALDVNSSHKKTVSNKLILKKTAHKTAGYTFIKPMLIGLALAGKYNTESKKFCEKLGENLGLAFQIQDDMLDITSDFKGNKTPLKDISEGTHTIFTNYVFKNGTTEQKKIISDNFGKEKVDLKKVRKVFFDSGAVKYGEELIRNYLTKSKKIAINKKCYLELIDLIEKRET